MTQFFPCPYLGQSVELTSEREQHIIQTHPGTLPDYYSQLAQTLNEPDEIFPSKLDPHALLFSKWFDTIRTGRYLVIVTVTDTHPLRHWIITAYTTRKLTGGS